MSRGYHIQGEKPWKIIHTTYNIYPYIPAIMCHEMSFVNTCFLKISASDFYSICQNLGTYVDIIYYLLSIILLTF